MTLRIIGGTLKRKKIQTVPGQHTRPTSDRVRESIFNIIAHRIANRHVLDLFSGTGAMGLEALSRGASDCTFIDNSKAAITVLKKNIQICNVQERSRAIHWDIGKSLACLKSSPSRFDLIFMDPPYHSDLIGPAMLHLHEIRVLDRDALLVIEHAQDEITSEQAHIYQSIDHRRYGKTGISILTYKVSQDNRNKN